MKNYYIKADLGDEIPIYDFVLKAKTIEEAMKKAEEILAEDYPNHNSEDFACCEITAEELLKRLTLN